MAGSPILPVLLGPELRFPSPEKASHDGLVAVGGDFSIPRLLLAYRSGIFPWTADPPTWWSPDPRGVFDLGEFHIPRSLERVIRRKAFRVTIDTAFREVMLGCTERRPGRGRTWISPQFIEAYSALHEAGHAHSIECWLGDSLAGGIYGVSVGGLFAGESMFHRVSNASKVALATLVQLLQQANYALFDIQMVTPITESMGAKDISRTDYLKRLREAVTRPCIWPRAITG